MFLPFVAGCVAFTTGYTITRAFNMAQNMSAHALYGKPGKGQPEPPYPWPPIDLEEAKPTNATTIGAVAALAIFAVSYKAQKSTVWKNLYAMRLEGAPKKGEKIETFGQFYGESAAPTAAWFFNCLTSSVVAGAIRPAIDGQPVAKKK